MELQLKADLTQTLGIRQMHDLMEIYIKTDKKYECLFIDKQQARLVIAKLQEWAGETYELLPHVSGSASKSELILELLDKIELEKGGEIQEYENTILCGKGKVTITINVE